MTSAVNVPRRGPALHAGLVILALVPNTIVIPVIRAFVSQGWPGRDWLIQGFMAASLLGAGVGGPLLAQAAERRGVRGWAAVGLLLLDAAMALIVVTQPPWEIVLLARLVQGAASVGAVSLLMGGGTAAADRARAAGVVAAGVVVALLVSIPIGAVLAKSSLAWPFYAGAGSALVAALAALALLPKDWEARQSRTALVELWRAHAGLRGPAIVVGTERFGVGAFVVTLQLFGHHVLGVPDGRVSRLFTVFLFAFAVGTYPATRVGQRVGARTMLWAGGVAYAAMFFALGLVPVWGLDGLMALGGLGAAAIFGPALAIVAADVPDVTRATAMAVVNAAGTLGMFLGNLMALALGEALLGAGASRGQAYLAVFVVAGVLQLVALAWVARRSPQGA